jgi:YgiT-type zinc finger domain-containing protein
VNETSATPIVRPGHAPRAEICPRCEDGLLVTVETTHEVTVEGSLVRIPRVRADECRTCGYRSLSGREARLIEVLFTSNYDRIADLVTDLRAAGYRSMFLREDRTETGLGFGSSESVESLAGDLRELYLDNETSHVLDGLQAPTGLVSLAVSGQVHRLTLPKLGEGENGTVFNYEGRPELVFKVAKPRPYCRDHLLGENQMTEFFAGQGVPVPRIRESDRFGRFVVKDRLAGRSLAVIYDHLGAPGSPRHALVRDAVRQFVDRLLDLFVRHPGSKVSVSPNNIFVVESGGQCECLLVDTGLAPFHDYSSFAFDEYWDVTVPQKIKRYREVGYIESDHDGAPASSTKGDPPQPR